jgi:hypothetical protein
MEPHRLAVHFHLGPDIDQQALHGADVADAGNAMQNHRLFGEQRRRQRR